MTQQLSQWQVDEHVSIQLEMEIVQMLQEGHGGWRPEMARCLSRIGKIVSVGYHTVDVEYGPSEKWTLNPAILTRVMPFELGDHVRVLEDERKVKELQRDHGGWVDAMSNTINQEGEVKRVFADGDLRVEVAGSSWTFNPHALIPLNTADRSALPHPPTRAPIAFDSLTLFSAVADGDLEKVKSIAQGNPQTLNETSNGLNPLHIGCNAGNAEVVSFLLAQGMDPNQTNVEGKTPLMFCCEAIPNPMCVRHLIQAGANPNNSGKLNNKYPLLLAIERSMNEVATELLQSQKCNVHVKDNFSQDTAMHLAAQNSNLNAMMNLLEAGATPDVVNSIGLTPFHVGLLQNSRKVVQYLLEKKPEVVNVKAQRGRFEGLTPLHLAILKDNIDCLSLLLDCPLVNREIPDDTLNLTPFLFAIYERKFHLLDNLIQTGCDVYVHDTLGNNALHILFNVNCDDYDTSQLSVATNLQQVFSQVEEHFGTHIRIAMCCYLIMNRIPYDKKNAAGVSPLGELNPDVRRYCEDKAPPLLPDCALCNKLAEFKNCPCGHVTYCVIHAINDSRCFTCRVEITRYTPLTPSAEFRRRSSHGINAHIPYPGVQPPPPTLPLPLPVPTHAMPTYPRPPVPVPAPESSIPKSESRSDDPTDESLANTNECSICMYSFKEVVRVAIDPCGHMCCDKCAGRLKDCHICRQPILKILRLFS